MNCLTDLAAPFDTAKFIAMLSGKKSFLVNGSREKFSGLFNLDRFYSAIQRGETDKPTGYRLSKFVPLSDTALDSVMASQVIAAGEVHAAIDNGNTICVTHIEFCDEQLEAFTDVIKNELHYLGDVQVNCYLSPDGSGAKLHFDSRPGMIVQLEGSKLWRYGTAPVVEWPLSNAQINKGGEPLWVSPLAGFEKWEKLEPVNENDLEETTLYPGDLLHLPAGTWHTAKASGYSLALNIAFRPFDYFSLLMQLLMDHFQPDARWRGGPAPFTGNLGDVSNKKFVSQWNDRLSSLRKYVHELETDPGRFSYLYDSVSES